MDRYKSRNSQGEENRSTSTSGRQGKKTRRNRVAVRPEHFFDPFGARSPEFSSGYRPPIGSPYDPRSIIPDPSVCRYSVPLGFSLEPLSLPLYPALYRSPDDLNPEFRRRKSRKKKERGRNAPTSGNDSLASSRTAKETDRQDYASLPPANLDVQSKRLTDDESETCFKRRFSDPGLAQASSDERFEEGTTDACSSDSEGRSPDFSFLVDEINDLKRANGSLTKQLYETRSELESLKRTWETWRASSGVVEPGNLSDAISEIRDAAKMREDALLRKVTYMLEENSAKSDAKKIPEHDRFEERLKSVELRLGNVLSGKSKDEEGDKTDRESSVRSHLADLEKEKLELKKELREAVEGRKKAEEDTRRLERLVGILRKKINGVSAESSIREEKHPFVPRPVASALERNPFVLANRYGLENGNFFSGTEKKKGEEDPIVAVVGAGGEAPEENGASGSRSEDGSSSASSSSPPDSPVQSSSLPAQVTMTGPVTDL